MRVKIICGDGHIIGDDELRDIKIIREIDPSLVNLVINTCDFVYQPKEDYLLAENQHIDVYYNDILHGRFYIDKVSRTGESTWNVQSYDAIGALDNYRYMGGMFNNPYVHPDQTQHMTMYEIIDEIIKTASKEIDYTISSEISDEEMYGYIPICSCREALAQICFSLGAIADTTETTGINIYPLSLTVSQKVEQNRIARNIQMNEQEKVSEVIITVDDYWNYSNPNLEKDIYNKPCRDYKIEFKTPYRILRFENSTSEHKPSTGYFSEDPITGKALANANYAVINLNENDIFKGLEYGTRQFSHSKKLSDSGGKTIELSGRTFVSEDNVEAVLERCAEYYSKRLKLTVKIYENSDRVKYGQALYGQVRYGQYGRDIQEPPIKIGEIIEMSLGYLGEKQGRIISERYNLNGNIILKECEILIL